MRLGVWDAGIGTGTETAFRSGLEAPARLRSESDIPRARAIQASDKRIAKESRVTGTQERTGLKFRSDPPSIFRAQSVGRLRLRGAPDVGAFAFAPYTVPPCMPNSAADAFQ